jgi:DNA-binding winged helix-turn-helix (wHTH) protein/TolB-like protein/Flp pilus assembly protein TadD
MPAARRATLCFGVFSLDLARNLLLRGNEELPLRRQSFDVLHYLVEHASEIVSKDELVAAVWAAAPADVDDSVAKCISDIRDALGRDARWMIRTISGRGYVFQPQVSAVHEPADPAPAEVTPAAPANAAAPTLASPATPTRPPLQMAVRTPVAAVPLLVLLVIAGWLLWQRWPEPAPKLMMMAVPSLAVLAFQNLGEPETRAAEIFADDVTTALARADGAHLLALTAPAASGPRPAHAKIAAGEPRYLLRGSLRGEGQMLHANVRLVEAQTGRQLWAAPLSWPRQQHAAQDALVMRVARTVTAQIIAVESRRPLPAVPEAGHFAILGRALLSNERDAQANKQALAMYERALALDPDWIPALLGYGRSIVDDVRNGWMSRDAQAAHLLEAERAIEHAIKLKPDLWGAHHLRGSLLRTKDEPDQAVAAFEYALALNPLSAQSHAELGRTMIDVGRAEETLGHVETAIKLSPTDPFLYIWCFWAGQAALHLGDDETAARWLVRARQANRAYRNPMPWLAVAYAGLGREQEAQILMREYLANNQRFTVAAWKRYHPFGNGVLASQRARIAEKLHLLGVPEDRVKTGSMRVVR